MEAKIAHKGIGLLNNRKGRMSFAAVAVLILMLSTAASIYMANIEGSYSEMKQYQSRLYRVNSRLDGAVNDIEDTLNENANRAVFLSTQKDAGDMNDVFQSLTKKNVLLDYSESAHKHKGEPYIIDLDAKIKSPMASTRTLDGEVKNISAYYVLSVKGTVGMDASWNTDTIKKSIEYEKKIQSPYLLMKGESEVFSRAVGDSRGDMASIMADILRDIAQYRILAGYGSYTGEAKDVLTESDLRLAADLALYLVISSNYRNFYSPLSEHIDNDLDGGTTLSQIEKNWKEAREVNPSDIFALCRHLDKRSISPDIVISQILNSIVDQLVFKYFDYFMAANAVGSVVNAAKSIFSTVVDAVSDPIGFYSERYGEKKEESGYDLAKKRLDFARKHGLPQGYYEKKDGKYRYYILNSPGEFTLDRDLEYTVSKKYISNVKLNDDGTETITYITYTVTACADSGSYELGFEHRQMDSKFWKSFDPKSVVALSLSTMKTDVLNIISKVSSILCEKVDDIKLDHIDIYDEVGYLKELETGIRNAISDMMDDLKKGNTKITDALANLLTDSSTYTSSIMSYITNNYDALAGVVKGDDVLPSAKNSIIGHIKGEMGRDAVITVKSEQTTKTEQQGNDKIKPETIDLEELKAEAIDGMLAGISSGSVTEQLISEYDRVKKAELSEYKSAMLKHQDTKPLDLLTDLTFNGERIDILGVFMDAFENFLDQQAEAMTHMCGPRMYPIDNGAIETWSGKREIAAASGRIASEQFVYWQSPDNLDQMVSLDSNNDGIYDSSDVCGVHYTSIDKFSKRPYEYTWHARVSGTLDIHTRSKMPTLKVGDASRYTWYNFTAPINIDMKITAYAGWGLRGAVIKSSNNFVDDVWKNLCKFFDVVWDGIKKFVGKVVEIGNMFTELQEKAIGFVQGLSSQIARVVSKMMMSVIEEIMHIIAPIVEPVKQAINNLKGLLERGVKFDLWGVSFHIFLEDATTILEGNFVLVIDIKYSSSLSARARLIVDTDDKKDPDQAAWQDRISVAPIIEVTSGEPDGDNYFYSKLDVFNVEQDVIFNGYLISRGTSMGDVRLDFCFPQKEERSDMKVVKITPVPIPIPPIGMQMEVSVGFNIVYEFPVESKVVINELELDSDTGVYNIELFNPGSEDIDLTGWTLVPQFNIIDQMKIKGHSIPATTEDEKGLETFKLTVDKKITSKSKFMGMTLLDNNGNIVDSVLFREVNKPGTSLQREMDGGFTWSYSEPTLGHPNSDVEMKLDENYIMELLMGIFQDSLGDTINQLKDQFKPNLDYVALFVQTLLENFVDVTLKILKSIVKEVDVILDFKFMMEGESDGPGAGLALGFKVCGEDAVWGFTLWLIDTIKYYIMSIGGMPGIDRPTLSPEIMENIWISIIIYSGDSSVGRKGSPDQTVSVAFVMNLPFIGMICGIDDMGVPLMSVQIRVSGNTHAAAETLFGDVEDDENPDILMFDMEFHQI